ncbi:ChaC-like protein [Scheffersomyces amazonensis]|uniref:ChaC-like protein n=1 Tax=Scheffersomyces amazonensis TaxID=1078765 RepID=UPI00315D9123
MTISSTTSEIQQGIWVIGYGSLIFKPPPLYSFKVTGYLKGYVRRFWQSSSDHRGTPESPGRVVTLVSLKDLKSNSKFHNDLHMYELNGRPYESEILDESESEKFSIQDIDHKISQLTIDDLRVWGVAYYISPEHVQEMKEYLDVREQDGYSTHKVPFHIIHTEDTPESKQVLKHTQIDEKTGDYFIESMIYIGTIDNESFIGPESIQDTSNIIKHSKGPSGLNSEYLIKLANAVRHLDDNGKSRDFYLEDLVSLVAHN